MSRTLEAKRELAAARQALDAGDPRHAAHHAAGALALTPLDPAVRAVVDELVVLPAPGLGGLMRRALGGDKRAAPLFEDNGFVGNVAARARGHELRAELDEALALVMQIAFQITDRAFVNWACELARAGSGPLECGLLMTAYTGLATPTMGLLRLRPAEQAFFAPWADLADAYLGRASDEDRVSVCIAASAFSRRAGRYARAAELAHADAPHALLDAAGGLALRAEGRFDEARAAFVRAEEADGEHAAEIARVLLDQALDEPEPDARRRALQAARDALGRSAQNGEVKLAMDALDEALDPSLPRRLTRLVGDPPEYDAIRRITSGQGLHDPMTDASTNVIPQLEDKPPPIEGTVTVNVMECPSALATLALRFLGAPDPSGLRYDYGGQIPQPPAFEPLDPGRGARLWRMQDHLPVQDVPPPPPQVTAFVDRFLIDHWAQLSDGPPVLSPHRAWSALHAHPDVERLDPAHLRAAMIHPTAPPEWPIAATWVFDRQVVCALAMAAQEHGRTWLAARRRDNLVALIFGPPDWTLAATLVALREVVLDDPDALEDARDWASYLVGRQPDRGHCSWARALRRLLEVPGMPTDLLGKVMDYDAPDE